MQAARLAASGLLTQGQAKKLERDLEITQRRQDKSALDQYYHVDNDETGMVMYRGFDASTIRYDSTERVWTLRIASHTNTFGVCKSAFSTMVLGNHDWEITNDYGCSRGTEKKRLTFSSCSDDEYTCNDGQCVDMVGRCDGKVGCEDRSDELDCMLVEDNSVYQKSLTPPPDANRTKIDVKMSIEIVALGEINEIKSFVEFQYMLYLTWYESRINFQNLIDGGLNKLTREEMDILWVPKLIFHNTNLRLETLLDEKAYLSVARIGNYTAQKNRRTFDGSENPLTVSRFYKTSFICNFDMAWYPFDTQKCSMVFVVESTAEAFVDISIGDLNYSGPKELTQYFIKKEVFYSKEQGGIETTVVDIFLGRRLLSIILTVFVPTIILNLVGHASNYFKEFFFEAIISVNVTAMLVLTTMFINVSNNRPKTAYIKMIDIWLLFNLIKPFNDILVHTYMDYLKNDDEREINHHGTARPVDDQLGPSDNIVKVAPVENLKSR